MSIYLKAKHWQLFVVLVGSMVVTQAVMFNSIMGGVIPNALLIMLPTVIMAIVFFGWLWSVSSACSKALPPELVSSPKPMQLSLIYAFIYLTLSGSFFLSPDGQLPGYVVIMHLVAMAAIFYSLGFTAKQLTKLDQNRNVSFFSYAGPFFLFWFFPIGVWFVQPKVNSLLGQSNA